LANVDRKKLTTSKHDGSRRVDTDVELAGREGRLDFSEAGRLQFYEAHSA
jgi:hypothetical protein